tara:strand:- start:12525 stop:12920 length:396 start_codon:yes stop_codon:yes gene_type:complete
MTEQQDYDIKMNFTKYFQKIFGGNYAISVESYTNSYQIEVSRNLEDKMPHNRRRSHEQWEKYLQAELEFEKQKVDFLSKTANTLKNNRNMTILSYHKPNTFNQDNRRFLVNFYVSKELNIKYVKRINDFKD